MLVSMENNVATPKETVDSGLDEVSLGGLVVRPIVPGEEDEWDKLMAAHHYLGFQRLTGPSLKYVAILDDRWVGLVGWGAGVLKTAGRDRWIGWSAEQKMSRLKYIVNNQRFLILPGVRIKNLASKILALNTRRLSSDWKAAFGHGVLLAETFVDPTRFKGTCYRAAGWEVLGQTRGYGRKAGVYYFHGDTKTLFVKPLLPRAREYLSGMVVPPEIEGGEKPPVDLNKVLPGRENRLLGYLGRIKDPRKRRGIRHSLVSVLAVAVCAIMSGCGSFTAIGEWAASLTQDFLRRLGCRRHPETGRYIAPSEPTLRRAIQSVDGDDVDQQIYKWLLEQSDDGVIAVDGKVIHGSRHRNDKPFHLVSAFLHKNAITVGQVQVETKSNEIPAFRTLLKDMDLEGKTVTGDAIFTQVKNANFVVEEKGADYVFQVKQNQATLFDTLNELPAQAWSEKVTTTDKGHGRIEVRSLQVTEEIVGKTDFPHVAQGIRVERETTEIKTGKLSHEVSYYIASRTGDEAEWHQVIRGHWGIENKCHYVRDVTFGEDASLIGKGSAPRVMATFRNLAIAILRLHNIKDIAKGLRACARNPDLALSYIGV